MKRAMRRLYLEGSMDHESINYQTVRALRERQWVEVNYWWIMLTALGREWCKTNENGTGRRQ